MVSVTINMTFPYKITKHRGPWSKSFVLVVVKVLDPRFSKFAWEKGLKKNFVRILQKAIDKLRILTSGMCWRVKLSMKLFSIVQRLQPAFLIIVRISQVYQIWF